MSEAAAYSIDRADVPQDVEIHSLSNASEIESCARLMSSSEPWITLGRTNDRCLQILRLPARESYVAYLGTKLAGFIVLNMTGAFIGYIQTICVAPEYRGRGVGSRMLAFAEQRIFQESPNVFMCVSSFNSRAKSLYERSGYEVVGELKNFLVSGHSEILLRKTLGPLSEFQTAAND